MAAGGSQVPATGDIGHWNTVVDEVRRCLIPETPASEGWMAELAKARSMQPYIILAYIRLHCSWV